MAQNVEFGQLHFAQIFLVVSIEVAFASVDRGIVACIDLLLAARCVALCSLSLCFVIVAFNFGQVGSIGQFDIACIALDNANGHFGHIAFHHATVVGSLKVRIGHCLSVSLHNYIDAKSLRRLHTLQVLAAGHLGQLSVGHFHQCVDRLHADTHTHRLMVDKCLANMVDNACRHQRACCIMEHEVYPRLVFVGTNGRQT